MKETLSSQTGRFQKWFFPVLALHFGVMGVLFPAISPLPGAFRFWGAGLVLGGAVAVFAIWWTVVRNFRTVVEEGDNLIVGDGPGQIVVPKRSIQEVEAVPGLKWPTFKVMARTPDGVVRFYFSAVWGLTERRIRGGDGTPENVSAMRPG